jgi:hypothetical protein
MRYCPFYWIERLGFYNQISRNIQLDSVAKTGNLNPHTGLATDRTICRLKHFE